MITIDVKTKAVCIDGRYQRDYVPMATNRFGDATPGYVRGWIEPNYPVPALLEHDPSLKHPQKLLDFESIRAAHVSYSGY